MVLPVGADIANFGFGSSEQNAYLQSPQFQANTTYGSLIGAPSAAGIGGFGMGGAGSGGFGGLMSLDGLKLIGGGLSTIGNLWNAFQAQKLAREQFNFQKNFANKNLANQIQSYNTALEDRARSRGFTEGQSQEQIDSYVDKNRL
ncbi:putative structural protein [Rhizobium phage RHph_X2_28B]|uniref:putative structural protein n=1 Tax=Rhizobium phage RHph_X2_28B TaxID=2836086 RepID=UPI0023290B77|nr:putative structural protein [Rhizobium phage RHph_X2_28B]QWY83522.1 putative structural protein [Rhizobium phage RHph_X2_28B]QWY83758.1 putative structural protein [Rhizobium phage RHph_X3_15]